MTINRTSIAASGAALSVTLLLLLLLLLAPLAEAQERQRSDKDKPTTQPRGRFGFQRPSDDEIFGPGMRGGDRGERGGGGSFGPGGGMRRRGWIDPAQWAQAEAFMKEHSPQRWAAFEKIPAGNNNEHRLAVMRAIYGRFRMLQNLREDDPALYDLRIKRLRLEDSVFGIVWELKHEDAVERKEKLETDLKTQVVELVDVGIQERGRRIERLEHALKAEKERFAHDQNNRDALVKEQLDRVLRDDDNGDNGGNPISPPSPGAQSSLEVELQTAGCNEQNEIWRIEQEVAFFADHAAL